MNHLLSEHLSHRHFYLEKIRMALGRDTVVCKATQAKNEIVRYADYIFPALPRWSGQNQCG